jgi:hypothetical protein
MSGMFGSTGTLPANQQNAFGLQVIRANTNQMARPVPMLIGQQRVGVTFITDLFNALVQPVTATVGKQTTTTGNNYYASLAVLCCGGPVDGIYGLYLNGEQVFLNPTTIVIGAILATINPGSIFSTAIAYCTNPHDLTTGDFAQVLGADQPEFNGEFQVTVLSATVFSYLIAATDVTAATDFNSGYLAANQRLPPILRGVGAVNSATFTLPNYATGTIYWGTETQNQDAYLNNYSGVIHPAYRGLCYIIFQQLFFGFNQTNVPNIEVVLGRYPVPSWGTESGQIGQDANPAYAIADLLQNPRLGLELPDSYLNTGDIDGFADQFANIESIGISKCLARAQDVRSIIQQVCETVDMLPIIDATGLLSILPLRPADVVADLPVIADAVLADLPIITPDDWTTTHTQTHLVFSDRALGFQDNSVDWRDLGVSNVVSNPDILSLDRSWITRADLATMMAQAAGQIAAIPAINGKMKLVFTDALWAEMSPGALFVLNFSLRPALHMVWRVTSVTMQDPQVPEFDVEFQADRTYLYTALIAAYNAELATEHAGGVPSMIMLEASPQRLAIVELPCGLCAPESFSAGSDKLPSIAILVARSAPTQAGFSVWLDKSVAWSGVAPDSYYLAAAGSSFAWHGELTAEYPATTRLIDLQLGAQLQLDGVDLALETVTAFDAMTNELLAFIDDEILSLAGWTLTGSGEYKAQFIRGRYATPIQNHAPGATVLLMPRATMAVLAHRHFQPGNEAKLKVTVGQQPISAVPEIDLTLEGIAWRVPAPCGLTVNGAFVNPSFIGDPIVIAWILPDPEGLLPGDGPIAGSRVSLLTRLTFFVASAQSYQVDVPWPAKTMSLTWAMISGLARQNFTVVAETISDPGWEQIASADTAALSVIYV